MKQITLLLLTLLFSFSLNAQTDKDIVLQTVNKATIESHIYFLADDLLKGRETGTPECEIAASYLANAFRRYGVKPNPKTGNYYQEVKLKKTVPPTQVSIEINGEAISNYAIISATNIDSNEDIIYLGYGLETDYANKNVKGKIVIIKGGSTEAKDVRTAFGLRNKKQQLAKDNGVIGLIELLNAPERSWRFIERNFNTSKLSVAEINNENTNSEFAYIWLLDKDNALASILSHLKTISAKISLNKNDDEFISSNNVIGIVEGTDPKLKNEYIIYSAHYDHVGIGTADKTGDTIYNGARDNAVGTTTVLSMAENLAKNPTKRSALFILFTAEEKGLLGSKYYVENPVLPLQQMVYCFNSDNAGYNDTSLATIVGLTRTTAAQNIKDAAAAFGLTAVDDPAPEQGLFDRSDNVHFARKGIPAPTFSLGFTAFNGDVTKYYHRPGDEANTLDYDYLLKFFQAYVLSGRKIANDSKTPVWTTGDKYEEVGKSLYKN
ncbi:M28 family peptidase [Olleya sp. AH-315-F22]|nr:M28 family peptidase [Olleya sp. AH-315-F22]